MNFIVQVDEHILLSISKKNKTEKNIYSNLNPSNVSTAGYALLLDLFFTFYFWRFVARLPIKPTLLPQKELQSQLLKVGTQLLTLPSSSNDLIDSLDKVGSLLPQISKDLPTSKQDVLVLFEGFLFSEELVNQAKLMFRFLLLYASRSSFGL